MTLDKDEKRILLDLVAMADAIHEPLRTWTAPRPAVVRELRRRYAEAGIRWLGDELASAGRKAALRTVEGLAERGLVELTRQAGKSITARLTSWGDAVARVLGGEWIALGSALDRVEQIAALSGKPGTTPAGYVPEPMLCGTAWGAPGHTEAMSALAYDLSPALVRGWAEASTTMQGHAWYRLTTDGQAVAEGRVEVEHHRDLPKRPKDGQRAYVAALVAARGRIAAMRPADPSELGYIPMPVRPAVIGGAHHEIRVSR